MREILNAIRRAGWPELRSRGLSHPTARPRCMRSSSQAEGTCFLPWNSRFRSTAGISFGSPTASLRHCCFATTASATRTCKSMWSWNCCPDAWYRAPVAHLRPKDLGSVGGAGKLTILQQVCCDAKRSSSSCRELPDRGFAFLRQAGDIAALRNGGAPIGRRSAFAMCGCVGLLPKALCLLLKEADRPN